jgi:hypothetical protein
MSPPQWPELLPFLYQLSASPQSSHREIGMFILFALLDTVADCLQSELGTMFGIFKNGLSDAESGEVRITTLRFVAIPDFGGDSRTSREGGMLRRIWVTLFGVAGLLERSPSTLISTTKTTSPCSSLSSPRWSPSCIRRWRAETRTLLGRDSTCSRPSSSSSVRLSSSTAAYLPTPLELLAHPSLCFATCRKLP